MLKSRRAAHKIFLQNSSNLKSMSYSDLVGVAEKKGFTVIEFTKFADEDANELINELGLSGKAAAYSAFVYWSNSVRLVFIEKDLSNSEKTALLRHELGHICDENYRNSSFSHIQKEEFANSFSTFLCSPPLYIRFLAWIKKRKVVCSAAVALVLLVGLFVFVLQPKFLDNKQTSSGVSAVSSGDKTEMFYVTTHGKKYHRENCPYIKSRTNVEKHNLEYMLENGYTPCFYCVADDT